MALALGSVSSNTSIASNLNSFLFNNVAGNGMVVVIESFDASATNRVVSTVTYNLVALNPIATALVDITSGQHSEIWYLNSPATGSNTLKITMVGSITEIDVGVITFTGADTTAGFIHKSTKATAATNSVTTTVIPTIAGTFLVSGSQSQNNATVIDATSTSFMDLAGSTSRAAYKSIAGTGSTSLTNTTGATPENMIMSLVAVAPPVSARANFFHFFPLGK